MADDEQPRKRRKKEVHSIDDSDDEGGTVDLSADVEDVLVASSTEQDGAELAGVFLKVRRPPRRAPGRWHARGARGRR